ncbi:hypothetical protein HPB52_005340 [Rhipicephalus sanguineus]|uniref:Uncharacterized protein n=1 Tax=Rhipicephalus sanguineus TaxID=34632 RepID=A0A9D4Q5J5_RHISA|nr:hypothetical protein HPB52_005340 [Rhipicephalus sanguineus]
MSQQGTLSSQETPQRKAAPRFIEDEKRGGPAPSAMAPIYQLVGSIAGHMATRVENAFDSDGTAYLPPVASLPVVRLLQPMMDGRSEADIDCQDEQRDAGSLPDPFQPPTGTGADEETRPPSVAQPEADENTAAPSCTNSPQVTTGSAGSTSAATVAAEPYRNPRGRMSVLEKTLAAENEVRAELLREEHRIRVRILQEDHGDEFLERANKRKFENEMRELELLKQKNELEKQKLQIEVLEIEKELKKEQLRRLQCNAPPL